MIRRYRTTLLCLALLVLVLPLAVAQNGSTRTIQGTVLGPNNQALSGAIVYLKNTQSKDILSYITQTNGKYLFGYTPANVDMQLWAVYKGKKSSTTTVSSFVSRKKVTLDLHVK
jgi:uncharacterized membrane protein